MIRSHFCSARCHFQLWNHAVQKSRSEPFPPPPEKSDSFILDWESHQRMFFKNNYLKNLLSELIKRSGEENNIFGEITEALVQFSFFFPPITSGTIC